MTASHFNKIQGALPAMGRGLIWLLLCISVSGCALRRPSFPGWLMGEKPEVIDEPDAYFTGNPPVWTPSADVQLTAAQERLDRATTPTSSEDLPPSPRAFAPPGSQAAPFDRAPAAESVPFDPQVEDALRAVEQEAEQDAATLGDEASGNRSENILELLPSPSTRNDAGQKLTLENVLAAVADSYPLLEVALAELAAADGKARSRLG